MMGSGERGKPSNMAITPPPTEERVATILHMMANGQWFTGSSSLELSKKWGIGYDAVARYSSEASRILRMSLSTEDREQLRTTWLATLERIVRVALDSEDVKALGAAVKAIETQAKICGELTLRHEIKQASVVMPKDPEELAQMVKIEYQRVTGKELL